MAADSITYLFEKYSTKFIVKVFTEVTIKCGPVRKRFIRRLQSNLHFILQRIERKIKGMCCGVVLTYIVHQRLMPYTKTLLWCWATLLA